MSHYCCKLCGQRYDDCSCKPIYAPNPPNKRANTIEQITGIVPKESALIETEEEKYERYAKFYEEVKALALKYDVRFK